MSYSSMHTLCPFPYYSCVDSQCNIDPTTTWYNTKIQLFCSDTLGVQFSCPQPDGHKLKHVRRHK